MMEVLQHISTLYYVTIAREIKIYIRKLLTFHYKLVFDFINNAVSWICQMVSEQTKENVIDNFLTD